MSNECWKPTAWPAPVKTRKWGYSKISITGKRRLATRVGPTSPLGPSYRQGPWVFWTHGCGKAGHDWVSSWWAPWSLSLAWPGASTLCVQEVAWSSSRKDSWSLPYFKNQVLVMEEAAPSKQNTMMESLMETWSLEKKNIFRQKSVSWGLGPSFARSNHLPSAASSRWASAPRSSALHKLHCSKGYPCKKRPLHPHVLPNDWAGIPFLG